MKIKTVFAEVVEKGKQSGLYLGQLTSVGYNSISRWHRITLHDQG